MVQWLTVHSACVYMYMYMYMHCSHACKYVHMYMQSCMYCLLLLLKIPQFYIRIKATNSVSRINSSVVLAKTKTTFSKAF